MYKSLNNLTSHHQACLGKTEVALEYGVAQFLAILEIACSRGLKAFGWGLKLIQGIILFNEFKPVRVLREKRKKETCFRI